MGHYRTVLCQRLDEWEELPIVIVCARAHDHDDGVTIVTTIYIGILLGLNS